MTNIGPTPESHVALATGEPAFAQNPAKPPGGCGVAVLERTGAVNVDFTLDASVADALADSLTSG